MVKNIVAFSAVIAILSTGVAIAATGTGFNQYGYNYGARIFNGSFNQWCQEAFSTTTSACDSILGNYANDKLIMKWNAQWDACNANGYNNPTYCLGAWVDNEFNGKFPGGSGEIWHYKIIWVGSAEQNSPYWLPGGYPVWGNYEVVMDQGSDPNIGPGHMWFTLAAPNGYGAVYSK
jgi:hypothetical protein